MTARVRALRSDALENRAGILAAARELLSERGPEGLTVSEVAHRAGVNRTTAYKHFRTRDELIEAVLGETGHEINALMHKLQSTQGDYDLLIDYLVERPEMGRLWMYWMLSETPLRSRGPMEEYMVSLRAMVEGPGTQKRVDADMLAHILISSVYVWSVRANAEHESETERKVATRRFARELRRLLVFGVFRPEDWPELTKPLS